MENNISIDEMFDELFHHLEKITIENYKKGVRRFEFEKFKAWKSRYNFLFDVFSNDHFINGKPHFHFKHLEKKINCKLSFDGEVLESIGENELESKILKILKFFLSEESVQIKLKNMWEEKNPLLKY